MDAREAACLVLRAVLAWLGSRAAGTASRSLSASTPRYSAAPTDSKRKEMLWKGEKNESPEPLRSGENDSTVPLRDSASVMRAESARIRGFLPSAFPLFEEGEMQRELLSAMTATTSRGARLRLGWTRRRLSEPLRGHSPFFKDGVSWVIILNIENISRKLTGAIWMSNQQSILLSDVLHDVCGFKSRYYFLNKKADSDVVAL